LTFRRNISSVLNMCPIQKFVCKCQWKKITL
jgi:hypothetical protein